MNIIEIENDGGERSSPNNSGLSSQPVHIESEPSVSSPMNVRNSSENEIKITETYDNTPKKWRKLEDVFTQCKLSVIDLENYKDASQDQAWNKAMQEEIS